MRQDKKQTLELTDIKLIVSDFDGTLLPTSRGWLDEDVYEMVREIQAAGLLFAAASGRQYANLQALMAPVSQDMIFLADNGALIYENGELLDQSPLDFDLVLELIQSIAAAEGCEAVLSGVKTGYVLRHSRFIERYGADFPHFTLLDSLSSRADLAQIEDTIIKVSCYRKEGIREVSEQFAERFGDRLFAAVSAQHFQDFTCANKGLALAHICRQKGLRLEQCLAFGDNYNDIEMLRAAGFAVVPQDAPAAVKAVADDVFPTVPEYVRAFLASGCLPPQPAK